MTAPKGGNVRSSDCGYPCFGWSVASIERVVQEVTARGGVFERYPFLTQDDAGVWASPSGAWIAWLKDPDGNLLSFTEKPRS